MTTQKYLIKRTADNRLFDIVCEDLLDDDEVIISATIKAQADPNAPDPDITGTLVFGDPMINPAPIIYPKLGVTADIGKAVQVRISGGEIPPGSPGVLVTLRLLMVTSANPALEATVLLQLSNDA